MKRTDFIKIIRLRSAWKISKSKGNYDLPGGAKLSSYIGNLVDSQLAIDNLAVARDGNLCDAVGGAWNKEKNIRRLPSHHPFQGLRSLLLRRPARAPQKTRIRHYFFLRRQP